MLKQPLLSRMFKLRGGDTAPVADKDSSTLAGSPLADSSLADNSPIAEPKDKTEKVALKKDETKKSKADPSGIEQAKDKGEQSEDKTEGGLKQGRKLKLPQKLSKVTTTQAAIALGLLAAASGVIIPRVASPAARANIAARLSAPTTPVSAPDDPTAEPLVTTGDLLLTNQILYRKLEAIAGVTLTNPGDRAAPTLPVPATGAAGTSAATSDSKPAAAKADGDESKGKEAEKPDPDVNVTADAPPAPVAEPVVFTGTTIDSVLEMRVAVAKDVSGIGFATSGNGVITDLDGNELKTLSPEVGVLAEDAGGLVVDGETMPSAFWVYPEDGGYVAVGDSWFRGRMLIAQRERGLIAVNYVLLGDYLYSVVGTEMSPDWALESLKAQAVAARSYALTHNIYPASEDYFDLDNTQRFQAYKGINREASTTQVAVQATAGEFISQEGGIVESLYAASQAIVDDAHKGAGMSQLGAKDLAEQGYSYQEILAHYYPGTALGRLETDQE